MTEQDFMKKLLADARPALRIDYSLHSPGFSRFGGLPNLPAHLSWPEWNGEALPFLAQIDLSELPMHPLPSMPKKGYLYFFFKQWGDHCEDTGSWAVLFSEEETSAEAINPSTVNKVDVIQKKTISFEIFNSLPSVRRLDVPSENLHEICDYLDDYDKTVFFKNNRHQIGGFPYPIYEDTMEIEAQIPSDADHSPNAITRITESDSDDWQLLLQLDTDHDVNFNWGSCGIIYFWVRTQDVREKNFSNVCLFCHRLF